MKYNERLGTEDVLFPQSNLIDSKDKTHNCSDYDFNLVELFRFFIKMCAGTQVHV